MGKRGGKPAPKAVAREPAYRAVPKDETMLTEECGDDPVAQLAAGDACRSPISAIAAEIPRWVDVVVCEAAETITGRHRTRRTSECGQIAQ